MGQIVSSMQGKVAELFGNRLKRQREDEELDTIADQPRNKMKRLTTAQYVYQTLFLEQKGSDVTIMALERVWHLHKIYLSQSPYFKAMFNGPWLEAQQDLIKIEIPDERVTVECLDAVLASLYCHEIEILPEDVISYLATGTLLHLDDIIDKCATLMVENLSVTTVIEYYEAASQYGLMPTRMSTIQWLEINLLITYNVMTSGQAISDFLKPIPIELMCELTGSPDLYVIEAEFTLYRLLRDWMFLRLQPDDNADHQLPLPQSNEDLQRASSAYFRNRDEMVSFLATPMGQPYVGVFQKLRTQYLTNSYRNLKAIYDDNIIPREWVDRHISNHWHSLLRIDEGSSKDRAQHLDEEQFLDNCMRYGVILLELCAQRWRWVDFNYGMDLVMAIDSSLLKVRRQRWPETKHMLGLRNTNHFMVRATVTSLDAQGRVVFTQSSQIWSLSCDENEEVPLLELDPRLVYPLIICVNMLTAVPPDHSFKDFVPLYEKEETTSLYSRSLSIESNGGDNERPLTPSSCSAEESSVFIGELEPDPLPPSYDSETEDNDS
ncbi:protein germ cell-less-like [Drosophila elegans]|uniref:protein germ cell-less-like n=1 Tax=Drosophila elegans TaxID=30023 RepID=UPI0007E5E9FC|nr:protein germ cell-less-like [Drosophila elegans]